MRNLDLPNAEQINMFMRGAKCVLAEAPSRNRRLYEPPLNRFNTGAVERWFTTKEIDEVINFVNKLRT